MKRIIVYMIYTFILCSSLTTFGMYKDNEATPLLTSQKKSSGLPIAEPHSITKTLAPKFGFNNIENEHAINFFYAIEDNKNIKPYLKNTDITSDWRVLTTGYAIAKKVNNRSAENKIHEIIAAKYPSMVGIK